MYVHVYAYMYVRRRCLLTWKEVKPQAHNKFPLKCHLLRRNQHFPFQCMCVCTSQDEEKLLEINIYIKAREKKNKQT